MLWLDRRCLWCADALPLHGAGSWLSSADQKGKFDELIEEHGVRLLIDPAALMHVLGTTMDYIDEPLKWVVQDMPAVTAQCRQQAPVLHGVSQMHQAVVVTGPEQEHNFFSLAFSSWRTDTLTAGGIQHPATTRMSHPVSSC